MKNKNQMQALLRPIILQAQQELLPPGKFYNLCQQLRKKTSIKRFYFLAPSPNLINWQAHQLSPNQLCKFLDRLAHYVSSVSLEGHQELFYLQRVSLRLRGVTSKVVLVKKRIAEHQRINVATALKIEVEIVGAGMIGRVARLRINDGKDLAFKAFFDPDFVWQHGPWAEIPIGIRLKACQVTK
ncbi:MAG: hypothetical protein F6K31_25930, partial [Symploca sp. SIO2G7]|nr:hypothetical protein [Symploca sp. SIO2G7]